MPAPTHNFAATAAPGTLRISVLADGEVFVTDLAAAALAETLRAFQDFAGLDLSSGSCKAVVAEARDAGDAYLIGVAALWLFLSMSDEQQAGRRRFRIRVKSGHNGKRGEKPL
jgi:hypothetical protein